MNPNLRTARILNKGELEVSTGVVAASKAAYSPVFIGAYGLSKYVELELKCMNEMGGLVPRFQILRSKENWIDFLISTEVGYNWDESGWYFAPGAMVGRKMGCFEPYLSWQFAKYRSVKADVIAQYILIGNRFHLPSPKSTKWFIGVESGLIATPFTVHLQYAMNLGFIY
jgi:hypothetical protein